eukprot:TRINITY_DN4766_c0_g4_i1.p1 TRINITY_DN4766_c0_g4~~TRINITY_DN4766_c0_g4_i1.p1  ORF type:complete len:1076 (-),score=303.59 TRINITY_DN4766_c0_g4_i1:79-3306(-)
MNGNGRISPKLGGTDANQRTDWNKKSKLIAAKQTASFLLDVPPRSLGKSNSSFLRPSISPLTTKPKVFWKQNSLKPLRSQQDMMSQTLPARRPRTTESFSIDEMKRELKKSTTKLDPIFEIPAFANNGFLKPPQPQRRPQTADPLMSNSRRLRQRHNQQQHESPKHETMSEDNQIKTYDNNDKDLKDKVAIHKAQEVILMNSLESSITDDSDSENSDFDMEEVKTLLSEWMDHHKDVNITQFESFSLQQEVKLNRAATFTEKFKSPCQLRLAVVCECFDEVCANIPQYQNVLNPIRKELYSAIFRQHIGVTSPTNGNYETIDEDLINFERKRTVEEYALLDTFYATEKSTMKKLYNMELDIKRLEATLEIRHDEYMGALKKERRKSVVASKFRAGLTRMKHNRELENIQEKMKETQTALHNVVKTDILLNPREQLLGLFRNLTGDDQYLCIHDMLSGSPELWQTVAGLCISRMQAMHIISILKNLLQTNVPSREVMNTAEKLHLMLSVLDTIPVADHPETLRQLLVLLGPRLMGTLGEILTALTADERATLCLWLVQDARNCTGDDRENSLQGLAKSLRYVGWGRAFNGIPEDAMGPLLRSACRRYNPQGTLSLAVRAQNLSLKNSAKKPIVDDTKEYVENKSSERLPLNGLKELDLAEISESEYDSDDDAMSDGDRMEGVCSSLTDNEAAELLGQIAPRLGSTTVELLPHLLLQEPFTADLRETLIDNLLQDAPDETRMRLLGLDVNHHHSNTGRRHSLIAPTQSVGGGAPFQKYMRGGSIAGVKKKRFKESQLIVEIVDMYDSYSESYVDQSLPEYIPKMILKRFGSHSKAMTFLHGVADCIARCYKKCNRVAVFGRAVGALFPAQYTPRYSAVLMSLLRALGKTSKPSEILSEPVLYKTLMEAVDLVLPLGPVMSLQKDYQGIRPAIRDKLLIDLAEMVDKENQIPVDNAILRCMDAVSAEFDCLFESAMYLHEQKSLKKPMQLTIQGLEKLFEEIGISASEAEIFDVYLDIQVQPLSGDVMTAECIGRAAITWGFHLPAVPSNDDENQEIVNEKPQKPTKKKKGGKKKKKK